jgi:hypothetical protein
LKDFVSDRRTTVTGSVGALLVAWALFGNAGSPFAGLPIAGLAILMMTTTVMCLGRLAAIPSLARVAHAADAAPAAMRRYRSLASRRSISAAAAD